MKKVHSEAILGGGPGGSVAMATRIMKNIHKNRAGFVGIDPIKELADTKEEKE